MKITPKVLIVDDNLDIQNIYTLMCQQEGFEVQVAKDGLDGISKAVSFKPDVILLDLMMPQMDGYEMLEAMRKNTSLDVKIIILSNIAQQKDIDKATKLGADMYLPKADNEPDQVMEKIKEILK